MSTVGVRELKNQLSRYLGEVEKGKRIRVTRRGKVIAYLVSAQDSQEMELLAGMVREGLASWSGGTPKGALRPVVTTGKSMSEVVLEERN